jgi:uncharacterized protein involved in exopolysaccharide biosynthesis
MSSTEPDPKPSPSRSRFGRIRRTIRRRPRRSGRVYKTVERPGLLRRTLRRHWGKILAVWLLGSLGVGYLVYVNVKPTYRALSLLRVDPEKQDLYNTRDKGDDLASFIQTQMQLITSPNVLTAAGTNRNAAMLPRVQKSGDVVQELRNAIKVAVIPNTYLIEVSMTSHDGYEAAVIVNAVVGAFEEANSEWSNGMTRVQIQNLEGYNVDLRNQMEDLERKWKTLAAKGNLEVGDPNKDFARMNITAEEYRAIQKQLNDVRLELAQAQAWLTTAKDAIKKTGKAAEPDEQALIEDQVKRRFGLDPEVIALKTEMLEARSKLDETRRVSTQPGNPAETRAKRKLDDLTTRWNTLWEARSPVIRKEIELGGEDAGREIAEASTTVSKLQARQVSLKTQFDLLDVKNRDQSTDAVEIALIQDQRQTLKGMQDQVVRRLEQLRYEARGEARIRPVNPNGAMVPTRPISDNRMTILAYTPLVMLIVSLGLFVGIEARSDPDAASEV